MLHLFADFLKEARFTTVKAC